MIKLRSQKGRYKIYTIDFSDEHSSLDVLDGLANQLDAVITGQDAQEGYELLAVFPFRYEYVVILKA